MISIQLFGVSKNDLDIIIRKYKIRNYFSLLQAGGVFVFCNNYTNSPDLKTQFVVHLDHSNPLFLTTFQSRR